MMIQKVTLDMSRTGDMELALGTKCHDLNPKELMLYSAAKCAGLTVLHVMNKEHLTPHRFEITVSGDLSTDTVRGESIFNSFHVAYNVDCGEAKDQAKAARAVTLTHDKYCGLLQMLRKIAPVTHETAIVSTIPERA